MSDPVIVALVSLGGTMLGTFGGIITSGKLTSYRIEQLEKKVSDIAASVGHIPLIEKEQSVANHRIRTLEKAIIHHETVLS